MKNKLTMKMDANDDTDKNKKAKNAFKAFPNEEQ